MIIQSKFMAYIVRKFNQAFNHPDFYKGIMLLALLMLGYLLKRYIDKISQRR